MYFRSKCKKNQEKPKVLSKTLEKTQGPQKKNQEPKIASKNPRSWEKTQAVATLVRPMFALMTSLWMTSSLKFCSHEFLYIRDAQPEARGPDPAPEHVISGPRSKLKIEESSPEIRRIFE